MQRIHFTAADVARTRLKITAGPLVESAFAYGLLGRGVNAPFARWRSQVGDRLSPWPGRLPGASDGPGGPGGRPGPDGDAGLGALLRIIEQGAAGSELTRVWQAAVAPYWDHLLAYLEVECEARGRVLMGGGAELLLATLHSRITWRAPVLEIHDGPDEDIRLEGRGLVLAPSVFLAHRAGRVTRRLDRTAPVVLAFAAPPDTYQAAGLWDKPDGSGQSLGALVGQTRAAALHVLRASCTTTQLADRLGISAAGASQHTAVLRRTGLITTRRVRNTVLHTLTPLGAALLKGMAAQPVAAAPHRVPAAAAALQHAS
ncbi:MULTISPECIES: helix-turn-helix transcriptional regulator [unclassified Streptomyces]|uniref:ArsR/SmtB family transcription factor n=1 Tax=unclassified Streptomyces TaxID=2593676 RepID=UPI001BEA03EB|nr:MULTISPECIES: winged helix-turn-helix domain-containing protein [unclassified Streptomyces]MBT2405483.1 winged helix-turn-helix transcriptional regulator [Streptomyces sp. ISL-21]MBT2454401.1 winged helix-turn-helix transcriptional regulator [Streptomyces sp. ISL-86]MBT2607838.1 winged helix-turn-helix transcriptional regulator [Streptomyces sp. ISL-87]